MVVLPFLLVLACSPDTETAAPTPSPEVAAPADEGVLAEAMEDLAEQEAMPEDAPVNSLEEDGGPLDDDSVEDAPVGEDGLRLPAVDLLPPLDELGEAEFGSVEAIVHEASGAVTGVKAILAADIVVRGVPCKEGKGIEAHADGRWSCIVSQEHSFGDFPYRRGARATLHANGVLAEVVLGDLTSPAESVTIAGVPCLSAATLHENGNVADCTLARGNRFAADVVLPRGSKVKLRDSGGLVRAEVYEPVPIKGTSYDPGTLLFDGAGGVSGHQVGVFGD